MSFDDSCWKTDDSPPSRSRSTTIFSTQISSPASSGSSWRNPSECLGRSRSIQLGGVVLEKNSNVEEVSTLCEGEMAPQLGERLRAKTQGDADRESRAWKLFGMVPLMLLHRPRGTGAVGRDELAARADRVDRRGMPVRDASETKRASGVIGQKKRGEAGPPRDACNRDKCPGLRQELTGASLASKESSNF